MLPQSSDLPGSIIMGTRAALIHYDTVMVTVNHYGHSLDETGRDIVACFNNPSAATLEKVHFELAAWTVQRVGQQYMGTVIDATAALAQVIFDAIKHLKVAMPQAWSGERFTYFFGRWHHYDLVLARV